MRQKMQQGDQEIRRTEQYSFRFCPLDLLISLLLCLGGCSSDLPAASFIDKLRVLAVRASPPEIAPGETTTLDALTVEPLLSPTALAVLLWLGLANLVFCVFTLLPGAPLDGGRLVRAAVWSRTRDRERAERVARRCGSALGATLMACGAAAVILFGQFVAIWLAVAGWLLLSARAVGSTSGGEDTVTP